MIALAAALLLAASILPPLGARRPRHAAPPPQRLSAHEVDLLRGALARISLDPGDPPLEERVRQALSDAPGAPPSDSLARVEDSLRHDVTLRAAAADVLSRRRGDRTSLVGSFAFQWDPDQLDADGLPPRGPTADEAARLEAALTLVRRTFAVDVPAPVPYRVDVALPACRVFPREDLRWGVSCPRPDDARAVARLALSEIGDSPSLLEVLAFELASCGEDAACREGLAADVRSALDGDTYVPIADALGAEAVGGTADPAFGSVLLVVERLRRDRPPGVLRALLASAHRGLPPEQMRTAIARATGATAASLDRAMRRDLAPQPPPHPR